MFKGLEKQVKEVLENSESARNSDWLLIHNVLEKYYGVNSLEDTFDIIIDRGFNFEIPSFESITRVRRKIQNDFPELRANDTVKAFREQKETEMKESLGYAN